MADLTRGYSDFEVKTASSATRIGPYQIDNCYHISVEVPDMAGSFAISIFTEDADGTAVKALDVTQSSGRVRGLTTVEDNLVSTLRKIWIDFGANQVTGKVVVNKRF